MALTAPNETAATDSPAAPKVPGLARGGNARTLAALLATLFVTLVLFFPIRNFQFSIIDDDANVYNNVRLKNPQVQDIGYFWRTPYYELYMPVTSTIWGALVHVAVSPKPISVPPGGSYTANLDPSVFHLASLLFHLAVTALVFLILRRLGFGSWACSAGALFFAVHPIQIQAVAWITGLNNLTGAFFGLLAIYVYSFSIDRDDSSTSAPPNIRSGTNVLCQISSTLLFIAALLSKPTTIVIPLFIIVFEVLVWRRPVRKWAGLIGFWLLLSMICGLITRSASAQATAFVWSPLWGRPFVVMDALAFYLAKLVYPIGLTFDYTRSPYSVLTNWWGYVTWIVPTATFWLIWRASKDDVGSRTSQIAASPTSRTWVRVGILIFVIGILPTLGIVPSYSQVVSTVFDRYLYLSLFGVAILVAHVMSQCGRNSIRFKVAIAVVLSFFALETYLQLPAWTDMNTQTAQMLAANPNSAIAHHDNGMILGARDDLAGALREFQTEVALQHGTNARGDFYLGVTLVEEQRYAEAIKPLTYAFHAARSDSEYWYQLWNALAVLNRLGEAEAVVREHLSVSPDDGRAVFTLGKMLVARGDPGAAMPYLKHAEQLLPNEPAVAFFEGIGLERLSRRKDAITAFERANKLDPGRAETRNALRRLRGSL